ncbi:hypothetical protein [Glutamicibacter sp. Je.9.36]|uniref:hypothetical protein n=1 Tax=Glutamicibacter sp. Je.9.36 TaxID=3142837 RepID=UPI003DA804DB
MNKNFGDPLPHQWFSEKPIDVTLFRINRRELDPKRPTIIPRYSEELLIHLRAVLELSGTISMREDGRKWNIGNLVNHPDDGALTARIGSISTEQTVRSDFDDESKAWKDGPTEITRTSVTGIAVLESRRVVGIAPMPGVSAKSIARVLAKALNDGEKLLPVPVTDWHVDPVMDEVAFWKWINETSRVTEIKTVFARPNPDGAEAWESEMARLDALEAASITETLKARDQEAGLNKSALKQDQAFESKVSAAKKSWAMISAKGVKDDQKVTYSQESSVASERITRKVTSWPVFIEGLIDATIRGRRKIG